MMKVFMILALGLIVLITGFYFRYRLKRRKYYRRTQPVQRITYERKVISNMGEEMLHFLSYLFIVGEILIFSFGCFVRHELAKEKQRYYQQHPTAR